MGWILLMDPYGEFNLVRGPWNRHRFFYSRASARVLSERLGEGGKYALVFGTDRVRLASSEVLGRPVLNFFSLDGNPACALGFLRGLGPGQWRNVERIYFLLDIESFAGDPGCRLPIRMDSPREAFLYSLNGFGMDKLIDAARTVWRNLRGGYDFYMEEDGSRVSLSEPPFDPSGFEMTDQNLAPRLFFSAQAAKALEGIEDIAREKQVPIVYFTLPLSDVFLRSLDFSLLAEMRRDWLKRIDRFYDLIYWAGVSEDHSWFHEASDLNSRGMRKVFREFLIPEAKSRRVSAANLEEHLGRLRERLEKLSQSRHGL